jgi:hypothetical protein
MKFSGYIYTFYDKKLQSLAICSFWFFDENSSFFNNFSRLFKQYIYLNFEIYLVCRFQSEVGFVLSGLGLSSSSWYLWSGGLPFVSNFRNDKAILQCCTNLYRSRSSIFWASHFWGIHFLQHFVPPFHYNTVDKTKTPSTTTLKRSAVTKILT